MTISSLSSLASLLSSSQTTAKGSSIGDQLLAAVAQAEAGSGSSSDAQSQDLVTLDSGSRSSSSLTYNAQGLLNQVQSSMLLNDPLLQTDSSGTGATLAGLLAQNLNGSDAGAMSAISSLMQSGATGTAGDSSLASLLTQSAGGTTGGTDLNANWAQALQKNPALAATLVESQTAAGLIGMLP